MLYAIVLAVNLTGWLIVVGSTFMVDHFDFIGLRQAWANLRHRTPEPAEFVTAFAYRLVRHPMMTGLMIGPWVVPAPRLIGSSELQANTRQAGGTLDEIHR